jgi:serine/threonine protein kinase/WD40 repeat protein
MAESSNRQKDIFLSALDLPSSAERAAFLDQACDSDPFLRRQVEAMLQAHFASDSFLEKPAAALGPTIEYLPHAPEGCSEGPGTLIGPYKLLQQIGIGGMGIVYMAEQQEPVRRMVALKIIKPGMDSRQVIARLEAERQALALMDHQNIARVLDAGTTQSGRPYFVMELVHGVPITTFCDDNQLSPRQRLELFIPVCHAIQHAHQKGIIHRDVKPSNILVTMYDDKPVPKVIDFGIAKAVGLRLTEKTLFTQFGALVGTFEYMSPEQAEMNALGVDTRSDIYSLGVLLYELLTGTTPLEKTRLREAAWNEVVRLIKEEEPPRPSMRLSSSDTLPKIAAARKTEPAQLAKLVRGELDWIVMKSLEKDRSRRYETANDLAQEVQRYLNDEPVQAGPPSTAYRMRKFVKRNRGLVTAATLVALTLLAGIIGTTWGWVEALWQWGDAERARDKAAKQERIAHESFEKEKEARRKEKEARRLMEAHLALERARNHFDRDQVTPGLHWLVRGLEAVPETEADLEQGFRVLLAGWGREIHPCTQVVTLAGLDVNDNSLLAQSPDGTVQVRGGPGWSNGGRDLAIELWDTNTGKRLGGLTDLRVNLDRGDGVHFAFTPDSRLLIGARRAYENDKPVWRLRTWNVATRKAIGPATPAFELFDDPNDRVDHPLVVSPDGKRLATIVNHHSGLRRCGVQLWEIPSGKRIGGLLPTDRLAVFSPDSRTLLTATPLPPDPKKAAKIPPVEIRVWDTDEGEAKQHPINKDSSPISSAQFENKPGAIWPRFYGPASEIHAAAFSPDGQTLVTVLKWVPESDHYELAIQRPGTNARAAIVDQDQDYHFTNPIRHLAFAADGKTVLVQSGDVIQFFRFDNKVYGDKYAMPLLHCFNGLNAKFIALSPDHNIALLRTENGYQLWDTATHSALGEPLHFPEGHADPGDVPADMQAGCFEADGKTVCITKGDKVYRFAVNMPRRGSPLAKSTEQANYLPVGQTYVVAAKTTNILDYVLDNLDQSKILLWDRALYKQVGAPLSCEAGKEIVFPHRTPDGRKLLTLGDFAQLWDAATHKPIGVPIPNRAKPSKGTGFSGVHRPRQTFAFSPDSKTVFLADGNEGLLLSTATGKRFGQPIVQPKRITAAAFSPDSKRLAIGTGVFRYWNDHASDQAVQLYDAEKGTAIGKPIPHKGSVSSITFSSNQSIIFSGAWASAPGPSFQKQWFDSVSGRLETVAAPVKYHFSSELRTFFRSESPGWEWPTKFRVWDPERGKARGPVMQDPEKPRQAVVFTPDRKLFVTHDNRSANHSTPIFWNTVTRMKVGRSFSNGQGTLGFAPDGKKLHLTFLDMWGWGAGKQQWLIHVPQPVRGTPEYLRLWIEVLTASEQDSSGGVTELDYNTWQERFERLQKLGGPPTP